MQVHSGLEGLPLFKGLALEEIGRFMVAVDATIKGYERDATLLRSYGRNTQIGLVVEGRAQIILEDRFGHEVMGHTLERGNMVGTNSAILPEEDGGMAVKSLTAMQVLWIPYHALLTSGTLLGRVHGIVMKNLLEALVRKNRMMMDTVELLSQKNLRERLIVYLLQKEQRQGREQVHVPGRVQLAKELECNRSALTREISAMTEAGMLYIGADWMQLEKSLIK